MKKKDLEIIVQCGDYQHHLNYESIKPFKVIHGKDWLKIIKKSTGKVDLAIPTNKVFWLYYNNS